MSEQDRDRSVIASFVIKNQCSWSVFSFRTWTNKLNLWYVYCSTVNRKLGYWPLLLRLFIGKANQGGGTCSRSNESPPSAILKWVLWVKTFSRSRDLIQMKMWTFRNVKIFYWKCGNFCMMHDLNKLDSYLGHWICNYVFIYPLKSLYLLQLI